MLFIYFLTRWSQMCLQKCHVTAVGLRVCVCVCVCGKRRRKKAVDFYFPSIPVVILTLSTCVYRSTEGVSWWGVSLIGAPGTSVGALFPHGDWTPVHSYVPDLFTVWIIGEELAAHLLGISKHTRPSLGSRICTSPPTILEKLFPG